jgi:hypothetical protein
MNGATLRASMKPVLLLCLLFASIPLSGCRKSGTCAGKDLLVEVSGNHEHAERISAAELERGARAYRLEGGSHEHALRLSEADLSQLAAGKSVERRSSSMNGHVHQLRLSCER